jgi:hypothetical protein
MAKSNGAIGVNNLLFSFEKVWRKKLKEMFYAYKIVNISYCKNDLELDSLNVTKKI